MPRTKFHDSIENGKNHDKLAKVESNEIDEFDPDETEEESVNPSITVTGIQSRISSSPQLSEGTVEAIALVSECTGIEPNILIGKILQNCFEGEDLAIVRLYRMLARQEKQKRLTRDLDRLETMRLERQRELEAIQLEIKHRSQFPG